MSDCGQFINRSDSFSSGLQTCDILSGQIHFGKKNKQASKQLGKWSRTVMSSLEVVKCIDFSSSGFLFCRFIHKCALTITIIPFVIGECDRLSQSYHTRAGIAQSIVCWARYPTWCSIWVWLLSESSSREDFSLVLTWVLTPFPKNSLDERINRGLVCAHMHFIALTQQILTFMSWTGECWQQIHTQKAPSMKMECDYLYDWIKKTVTYAKISPKMVNPRDIAGNTIQWRRRRNIPL